MTAHLDYEFRSGVDITDVGSHRTSIDPRFELFMAGVSREGDPYVYLWINPLFHDAGVPHENEAAERILAEATIVYAHNAPNEQANTWGALQQGKACPFKTEPPITIWRCTAAEARKAGLPYSLDKLCSALGLVDGKDRAGKALIKFFSTPKDDGTFNEPRDFPEKWAAFCNYCRQDVRAEIQCGEKLKPFQLTGAALATFQFDLRMNQRGIPINLTAARNAQRIIDEVQAGVRDEFRALTGLNVTQRDKVKEWLATNCGLAMPDMQSATIETTLAQLEVLYKEADENWDGETLVRTAKKMRALKLYQSVSYAAVKKVSTMLDCACPDGRVRGGHMYYGAGTGRWSGKLLQPQNFKKTPPELRPYSGKIYEHLCRSTNAEVIDELFCSPLEGIASSIRHFIHDPKTAMLDGDYSGVEARIIAWLAGQEDVLQEWRDYDAGTGLGPYKHMAAVIYGIGAEAVTKDQREVGKRVVLGAGFQMGPDKFQESCRVQYGLDLPMELCVKGIKAFRRKCDRIRDYWWSLNNSAISAIRNPGATFGAFTVRRIAGMSFLLFRLRSGRALSYPHPEVNMVKWVPPKDAKVELDEFGDPVEPEVKWREEITYWGQIPGSQQWGRIKLYGGKLAENETQATAADFMAHGAITAESRGMPPFMLVHDQGLALKNGHTEAEFERALGDLPAWAKGFPMKVEVGTTPYFTKE